MELLEAVRAGDVEQEADVASDVQHAHAPGVDDQVATLRARYAPPGGILGVGVDRMDYSKGLPEKIKALDKSKTYLVYCGIGGRSAKACKKLDTLAFPNVYNLDGGIKAWEKAGKPLEK